MASDLAQVNINTYCNSMAYYYTFKSSQQICPITALRLAITVLWPSQHRVMFYFSLYPKHNRIKLIESCIYRRSITVHS